MTFTYDLLGHPLAIVGSDNRTDYVYSADGRKFRATHTQYISRTSTAVKTRVKTDYRGRIVANDGSNIRFLFDGGFYTFKNGALDVCHYFIQDYQGNNRILIGSNGQRDQYSHYYPYGGLMGDISTNDPHSYKYGGKELDRDFGIDLFDFEARQYDAKLPAFTSIDPLAEKYYGISPYAYCAGDPVNCVDPTGMDTLNISGSWDDNDHWVWSIDYKAGGDQDIYNVTNPNGSISTYTFDKDADISQLYLEDTGDSWLSVINVKGKSIYGFAVNPAGGFSEYSESGTRPSPGSYPISPYNNAGRWRCAGPTVFGLVKNTNNVFSDRQIRIHYAGWDKSSEDYTKAVTWTTACSVVSSHYKKNAAGSIMYEPKVSFALYDKIQTALGGIQTTYSVKDNKGNSHTRYGYSFSKAINKIMQIK